jgi:chromate transport protein
MSANNPKESNVKKILSLFLTFLKIGTFTFGGGYAMIPLIQREIVQKRKWITDDDILEITAIAESTPGPIAVNTATFVGYRICKFGGAFFSTLGVVLPSFLIIAAISYVLREFLHIKAVRYAFYGIRAGVLALILKALWTMYRQCPAKVISYTIAALAFISVAFFKINVLFVLPACALIGLISSFAAARRKKR